MHPTWTVSGSIRKAGKSLNPNVLIPTTDRAGCLHDPGRISLTQPDSHHFIYRCRNRSAADEVPEASQPLIPKTTKKKGSNYPAICSDWDLPNDNSGAEVFKEIERETKSRVGITDWLRSPAEPGARDGRSRDIHGRLRREARHLWLHGAGETTGHRCWARAGLRA